MARATTTIRNFHLPLSESLHRELRAESHRTGKPTTALVREAVEGWLDARRREARHAEIAAFADRWGGTDVDLDPELEVAAAEQLRGAPTKRRRRAR
jgi:hypothetical protein